MGERCERLVVAPAGVERAMALLGVNANDSSRCPTASTSSCSARERLDRDAFWRRALVQHPQGWLPGQPPGSARYSEAAVAALAACTVMLYVGRFTAVKRLDLLIGAFARAQSASTHRPGSCWSAAIPANGRASTRRDDRSATGNTNVYLAGWHAQEELPVVLRSRRRRGHALPREQFGQALIEGMACGLPAIATQLARTRRDHRTRTHRLAQPPDDETALATALTEAINDAPERQQRGHQAHLSVREHFSWTGIATQLMTLLETITDNTRHAPAIEA